MINYYIPGFSVVAMLVAMYVTWAIARQINKYVSQKVAAIAFLVIAILPIYHIIKMVLTSTEFWQQPFFFIWITFASYCIIMYFRSKRIKSLK